MRRLIEEDFPIQKVSEESAREKSIRHGHISTLHIWWARRPLAACRAAIFASLVPDPATLIEPIREYVDFLLETLPKAPNEKEGEWANMRARKRLAKFTADISPWEACNNQRLLNKARKIIEVGTAVIRGLRRKELTEVIEDKRKIEMPKVLDPFAGGGSIPLEALRLGCEAHAIEYNPVAVLILKGTLEYPQKYGERLVEDVEKLGNWVLEQAKKEIGTFYPEEIDPRQQDLLEGNKKAGAVPVAYIWARTMPCQNPSCGAEIPLMRQFWLRRQEDSGGKTEWGRSIYLHPIVDKDRKQVHFEVVKGKRIDGFDPTKGTRATVGARATFACPLCGTTYGSDRLRKHGKAHGFGQRMICVILDKDHGNGKEYRPATQKDIAVYKKAEEALKKKIESWDDDYSLVPDEPLPPDGTLGFRVNKYGVKTWGQLFNARQLLCLITFVAKVRALKDWLDKEKRSEEEIGAVLSYLSFGVDMLADFGSMLCMLNPTGGRGVVHTFGRQALPMVWDYAESNPFHVKGPSWEKFIEKSTFIARDLSQLPKGCVVQGSAVAVPKEISLVSSVITDPPYYDSVPYADLSDFFYVWLKRMLGDIHTALFSTPLTPKSEEIIQEPTRHGGKSSKAKEFYEHMMTKAFSDISGRLDSSGITTVVFAHKRTEAWETLVNALVRVGLVPSSSWPVHTERAGRLRAQESAALASSFFLACRRREGKEVAYFKDIKQELDKRIMERLDHFWEQGIRGADFFISAIGPAVEVFGRYEKVKKLSGEEVTVPELLDEVRKRVTQYALRRVLARVNIEKVDALTQFYVLWRWTYNGETVPYDDARKLSQAVGVELDEIRGKGRLVSGKDKITVASPDERKLDEIAKKQPVSLIDALHKACLLWKADKRKEMEKFLSETGFLDDPAFWETAQDLSDLLPDGDKEKQMIQGLLMKAPTMAKEPEKQLTLDKGWSA